MKKIFISITILLIGIIIFYTFKLKNKNIQNTTYLIGILQTASHPSLDKARDSFIEKIKLLFGKQAVEFILFNSEGSSINAYSLAQKLVTNKNIDLFYAIASPAAQCLHQLEKIKPIIISAVSAPHNIGLVYENTNVCGITDTINSVYASDMIIKLVPNAKTIGLLYSSSALNKEECAKIRLELEKRKYTVIDLTVLNESELNILLKNSLHKVDAILSPCDNIIASTLPLIIDLTIKHKKPFLACFNEASQAGAFASRGIDYFESGKQAAKLAFEILIKNKKPYSLGIIAGDAKKIFINKNTAEKIDNQFTEKTDDIIFV